MDALKIENLAKTYKNKVHALKGITLEVKEGDFFALLGPNGAGKTTTIGIIIGLTKKTSGQVYIFNKNIENQHELAKTYIGIVPQEFNFNIFEKVIDIVTDQAGYYGIPKKKALDKAEYYLKKLGLWEKRNMPSMTLSGGMKRKLMIVRALTHEPKLLILDEPTAGVDIETRRNMWNFLRDLNKQGTTIILTTHYLEEAEQLCKNVAIIDKGLIVANTTIKDLIRRADKECFILDTKEEIKKTEDIKNFHITQIDKNTFEVCISKKQSLNALFDELSKQKIEIISMRNKAGRLEELFVELTKNV